MPSIPSGSWIDGTFNIWIGHREDHEAWELLARARSLWKLRFEQLTASGKKPSKNMDAAFDHLLAAEGSDWCWWYGDEHFTSHGPEFDRLFRSYVKAAYRELGETPPDSIDIPIIRADRISVGRNYLASPSTYIRPNIDGKITSYYEWSSATRYTPRPEIGTMHRAAPGSIEYLFYGFDKHHLYLRLDFHGSFIDTPDPIEAEIFFPAKKRKISLVLFPAEGSVYSAIGNIGEILLTDHLPDTPGACRASFDKVLELGVPFRELGCEEDSRMEFFFTIVKPGAVGERWPMYGTFIADLPGKDFEERMWGV